MKIAATVSDFGAAAHTGALVENTTFLIDIPDNYLPQKLRDHLEAKAKLRAEGKWEWVTVGLSFVEDE